MLHDIIMQMVYLNSQQLSFSSTADQTTFEKFQDALVYWLEQDHGILAEITEI